MMIKGVITGSRNFIVEGNGYVYGAGNVIKNYEQVTTQLGETIKTKKFGTERYLAILKFGGETSGRFFSKRLTDRDHVAGNVFKITTPKVVECLDMYYFGDQKRVKFDLVMEKESKEGKALDPKSAVMKIDGFWTGKIAIGNQ